MSILQNNRLRIQCRYYAAKCLRTYLLLSALYFLTGSQARAQNISNAGTEFWSVFPTHEADNGLLANLSVFITSSQASSGTVMAGSFSKSFSVAANSVIEIQVPRSNAYINDYEGNQVLSNRAIHILVDTGKPKIVVYTHIFAGRRSAASLILPGEALGQQYFSMNYTQDDAGQNYITIIATEANTKVHLKKGNTELVPGGVTLNKVNDVYEYLSTDDLTGVSVTADTAASGCNSFAVFSGSSGVRIGTSLCTPQSIDPLFQQCYPVTSWGKNYGFVPFSMKSPAVSDSVRTAGQYVRVLAKSNGTIVSINGQAVDTLNKGEYYTTKQPLKVASYITGSQPISVAQYALTQSCSSPSNGTSGYSDPDMVILNPIEYNINHITVYSSTKENITEQYINILIKTSAVASFRINNTAPIALFKPMGTLPGYSYGQLSLNSYSTNTFNLNANEGFNAVAYGFGNVESYSYSAGTNLAANESITAVLSGSNIAVDSTCIKDDYFFKLTLPYQPPQISWQMDENENPTIQNNPVGTLMNSQGISYYEYTFPKTAAYQVAGRHKIKILAQYPTTIGGCSKGQQVINYTFTVIPVPAVNFTAKPEKCHNIIDFTDQTSSNTVNNIASRFWDFGDGKTSALQNPVHIYADSGIYIVKLTTAFTTGCQDYKLDTLHIKQKTFPGFFFSNPDCVNNAVTFTDTSKTIDFIIATRKWNFGDGDSLLVNNNTPFQHVFKKAGTYQVKLTLINTEGCLSQQYEKPIVIYDNPVPDFKLPAVCLTDQLAQFNDVTTIPDSTEKSFTYLWNFGDPNANDQNPNTSTLKNPVHRYIGASAYTVTLTVTTAQGCTTTISKQFIVNGANPVADFKIMNNKLCANEPAIVQNNSSVDFGSITKLEWHFDNSNHPDSIETDNYPTPGQLFSHQYPVFHSPASKSYVIKLLAYSGTQCVRDTSQIITVMAVPQVTLDSLSKVCISGSPIKITRGHEISGITGTGAYYGDGISTDGTFAPSKAGVGIHAIKYKFSSDYGCVDSVTRQITVVAEPVINAGNDTTIMLGDQITLRAKANSSNLTYKWVPATGLNHDDIANPIASPGKSITYTVTASNGTCQAVDDIYITVIPPLIIPNTFTPNGDGINDVWDIQNLNFYYPKATVDIYSKYGRKVFTSVGYGIPWDGKYKGQPMPSDTYYYIINLNYNDQKRLASWLQLIR
ncbi:PKD domain-containing protein [Mucilaginibacter paludis]|uniref:PKD domain containing protein n=1 Tax=Mucilaginibacter paludis DSM 18603 TaxID=714943 RepID=H1YES9_9SPHI|nr:PKD domain-containing protein [Mucilaginibacter paludis]EHQ24346.1 PKD domain containing protein [Mucilaginibacter paludis DSM 18603]